MMYWDGGWSWWWMLPMMTFMVVLIGAVIWGVVAVTRSITTAARPGRPTAEDILNERFARGEIDVTEYRERVDALYGAPPTRQSAFPGSHPLARTLRPCRPRASSRRVRRGSTGARP